MARATPMTLQKLIILFVSLCGGALGLFAPIGFVKWLLQTEPEDAGILTLFLSRSGACSGVGLLMGRWLGLLMTGGKRRPATIAGAAQRGPLSR